MESGEELGRRELVRRLLILSSIVSLSRSQAQQIYSQKKHFIQSLINVNEVDLVKAGLGAFFRSETACKLADRNHPELPHFFIRFTHKNRCVACRRHNSHLRDLKMQKDEFLSGCLSEEQVSSLQSQVSNELSRRRHSIDQLHQYVRQLDNADVLKRSILMKDLLEIDKLTRHMSAREAFSRFHSTSSERRALGKTVQCLSLPRRVEME
jgi:myosin heavy subunit